MSSVIRRYHRCSRAPRLSAIVIKDAQSVVTMHRDCLQVLAAEDLPRLLGLLRRDLPHSTVVYHWLLVQTNWANHNSAIQVQIFCPGGDWRDGTVVAFTLGLASGDKTYGVVYAREGKTQDLARILKSTRVIPWRHVLHFSGVLERHVSAVREAATWHGIVPPTSKQAPCHLVVFDEETTKRFAQVDIPEHVSPDVTVRQLRASDVEQVWGLRDVFSPHYKPVIEACLRYNFSSGVFVRQEDGSEVLASMVLQTPYGGMGMGASHPRYLKRGYHAIANAHLMCAMSKSQFQLHGHVNVDNQIVFDFSQKYGMKIVGATSRVDIVPGEYHVKPRL